ncbi:MAG: acetolactate synthase [endosymbiont of Galathealinum brachiosum]|uniref:Acetolactate synthase n=1 Tax=endosymbiont of Galathealinum brachiosum TaxID=2200906 RepID=A0A370D893_9GAMM|nr:MAG: acetolactate synthase [endosymbiont of Galathealinum brachiosum]
MKIKVSDLIVRYLERLGVEYIFGMPGAHILPVYDSLYNSDIQSVLAKHEQGAAFMAGGCARASNRISACITTAGPGATNLVTGIANAYADKLPVIIITGEAPTYIFGKGGLQESSGEGGSIDQDALFKGITRYNKVIERTDYLENVLNQVSKILLSDSSGPVLLSFPYNVQKEMIDDSILDAVITKRHITAIRNNSLPVEDFTQFITQADKPVIIAGHGCIKADAQLEIDQLSELLNIPVTTSLKGKGVISEQSERSLGSLGVTSYSEARNYIIEKSDLLIFLGASFNERTSYLWDKNLLENKKIIQVDTSPEQLEKVFKADLPILGDIKQVIAGVLDSLNVQRIQKKSYTKVKHDIPTESDAALFNDRFSLIKKFFDELESHFSEDMMIFDDNIIFAQNFFNVSNGNRYYSNSGISSLGHAIPAAIGARFAIKHPTLAVLGDGGFQMCCMELMTAVNYKIPLTVIMFNNSTMGLIRKNQFQQYEKRFIDCDFVNPDYKLLADSFGIEYKKVELTSDLDGLFENIDYQNSINLIEIIIDKDLFPTYSSRR